MFGCYSDISDQQLDLLIRNIKQKHPAAGEVIVAGYLRAMDLKVQRARLRNSLYLVDRDGIAQRRVHAIQRRQYYVPSPNFIWHLDGTHKLERWKMVIHAAIDGYSRLITFCLCFLDNKSETVLQFFNQAEAKYFFLL